MQRGELYLVQRGSEYDPKRQRAFVIVSRQELLDSRHSTVICAPVHTSYEGAASQVPVGIDDGLKHDSSIHCDELISIPKHMLTHYLGTLSPIKLKALNVSLVIALSLEDEVPPFPKIENGNH